MGNAALPSVSEQKTGKLRRVKRHDRLVGVSRRAAVLLAAISIIVGAAAGASVELYQSGHGALWSFGRQSEHAAAPAVRQVFTAPEPVGAQFTTQTVPVDSMFAAYYQAHDGATRLGKAITPALAVDGGWLQVFTACALYLPAATAGSTAPATASASAVASSSQLTQLVKHGVVDPLTGIVTLPLLTLLLTSGSEVSVGGSGAPLTYADLRTASGSQRQAVAPPWYRANAPTGPGGTFIPEQVRNGVVFGHMVPPAFWTAMNDTKMSPDGWAADFGRPLTEALMTSVMSGTQPETVVVQLFEHNALIQVQPAGSSTGQKATSAPHLVPVGLDYLRTFGPPPLRSLSGTPVWSTGAVTLSPTAGATSTPQESLGENFPLTLQGDTAWVHGALWYEASWQTPLRKGTGWVPAASLSLKHPSGVASVGFDALDPRLASYLAGFGGNVGAVVYDVTHGIMYQYNPSGSFIVASSVKVPIMLALLTKLEAQGRDPDSDEMSLLTTMIENSNNDSAQALYEEIGDAPGLAAFMAQVHIAGLNPSPGTWGWSTITPQAMVSLLTLLQQGKILSGAHRSLALSLMEHVETDQQIGVGSTAPTGAIAAMKDGWVPGPDGMWEVNSSGIVTVGPETFIISVYTGRNMSLDDGWATVEHVCGSVAQLLS
jgi:Beta-lactamase enzyme family